MKKRYLIVVALSLLLTGVYAVEAINTLPNMPAYLLPVLPREQKSSLRFQTLSEVRDTISLLNEGYVVIDEISEDKTALTLSVTDAMKCYIYCLDWEICLIRTYCAPLCSSVVGYYDYSWNLLREVEPPSEYMLPLARMENGEIVWTDQHADNFIER